MPSISDLLGSANNAATRDGLGQINFGTRLFKVFAMDRYVDHLEKRKLEGRASVVQVLMQIQQAIEALT